MAFVHHTASSNDYTAAQSPAIMRGVYAYHTKSLHWSDVGYNFLIDRYGTIYEGRYGGVTRGVIGAQVLGFNTGSTGISVIGTFSSATPPSKAVVSLERLLEWKLDIHHLDPQGTGTLVCGYGQKSATGQHVKFPAIAGHRDANFTDCPGGRLYAQLPNIRKVVARTGQPKIYGFIVEDPAISPDGDGVNDLSTIGFTLSQTATWRLEIRDAAGQSGAQPERRGQGRRDHVGRPGTTRARCSRTACTPCRSTRRAPTARRAPPRPPCGWTRSRRTSRAPSSRPTPSPRTATARTMTPWSPSSRARLAPHACPSSPSDDTVLRRVTGWKDATTSVQKAGWDGRISSGSGLTAAPEGEATLLLELRDAAGNTPARGGRSLWTGRWARVDLPQDVLAQRGRRRATRRHALVPAQAGRRRDGYGRALRLHRQDDPAGQAGRRLADRGLGRQARRRRRRDERRVLAQSVRRRRPRRHQRVQALTVDLTAPKLAAPARASVAYRKTAKLAFTVRDAFSAVVKVSATITNAKGVVVATVPCGWVKQGVAQSCVWKPRARRTYTVTFRAMDLGGNRQTSPAVTSLRVR